MTLHPIFCIYLAFLMTLVLYSIQGNPKLCQTDKCKNNSRRVLVPVVASIASLIVIVVVPLLIFFAKKKTKLKGTNEIPQCHNIIRS